MESSVHVPTSETAPVWTDEKHLHFLNSMEASFVRAMLHGNGRRAHSLLRLDRHLPDSSDSTLDLKPQRRARKHAPSADSIGPGAIMQRRTKRRSSHPYNSSKDQVVPQLENGREGAAAACVGDDDKEQRSNV